MAIMDTGRLNYLLERFANQELSPAEQAELDAWYEEQQQGRPDMVSPDAAPRYITAMSQDILNRLHQQQKKPVSVMRRLAWVAAASVVAVLTAFFFLYLPGRKPSAELVAKVTPNEVHLVAAVSVDTSFYLPDGSFVTLSPGASIVWGTDFNDSTRTIQLTNGNGYFKVHKDKSRPFIVISQDISTTALGTAFTVSSSAAGQVDVVLHEGKVVVQTTTKRFDPVYMTAGDQLAVNVAAQIAVRSIHKQESPKAMAGPRSTMSTVPHSPDVLEFRQDSLGHVLHTLASYYNIHISFDRKAVALLDFSGKVRRRDQPSVILRKIALLHHLELVETNGRFQFRKQ